MKKLFVVLPALLIAAAPIVASAHAHASYMIGGVQYDLVVGSLNEPIAVDDKTGVDFRVTSGGHMEHADDGDMEPVGGKPTAGLESTLKVELIAGDKKKTLDLSPVFNTPGSYKVNFFPTVATTLSYRFFGEINGTPVDLTFTCRAEGATATEEGEKEISTGVKQLMKGGGFGCPAPKEDLGFPQQSASLGSITDATSKAKTTGMVGAGLGAVGLALAAAAFSRRRN